MHARTAQVEALNNELGTFNYSVSHDLRAPLRRIAGLVKALEEDCAGKLDSERRQLIQNILASTQHMTSLIEALLKLASFSSRELQWRPTNLSSMVRVISAELQQGDPGRHVEFVIAEDVTAAGDAGLLRAVLENLLGMLGSSPATAIQPALNLGLHRKPVSRRPILCGTTGLDSI
ncbi:MAG: sensor histidine kinase [Terriglobia bacterium]